MKDCIHFELIVNDELFTSEHPALTRHDILRIAGIAEPDKHTLYQLTSCGEKEVEGCERVNLRGPNTERFVAVFNCQTAGEGTTLRRDVPLAEKVERLLDALGFEVETMETPRGRWAVTSAVRLPPEFAQPEVRLAVPLPDLPETPLDMVWCSPALSLKGGRAIAATTLDTGPDETKWQRWSRHYQASWDARHHNLATHLRAALNWIRAEAGGR